jgi:predicted transcriptional regulator
MTKQAIILKSELIERLETLAEGQGLSLDDMIGKLLSSYVPERPGNWALAVAEGMEAAEIDWIDDPEASAVTGKTYKDHLHEKWRRTQEDDEKLT